MEFAKSVEKGLGFELQIICGCKESEPIPSSPKIKNGLLNFCGLMDISATALSITGYYKCTEQVYIALKAVSEIVFKEAAKEEQEKNKERGLPEHRLTVSGDGS